MNSAVSWLALAAALAAWPGGRAPVPAAARSPARLPIGHLAIAAGAAVAAASVALCGLPAGALLSVLVGPATVRAVRRLPTARHRGGSSESMPLVLDLLAAALRAGQPVEAALDVSLGAASDPQIATALQRVAGLLRLGAEPAEAWSPLEPYRELEPVVRAARRSSVSGIRLAGRFEEVATELRLARRARAEERAARAGVLCMAPLALCFLPAFVCLGIGPAVVGIGSAVLTTLP